MTTMKSLPTLDIAATCELLLDELQMIWDEVGESAEDRDGMLRILEQECLEIYKRTVDRANHVRARLHQTIAEMQAELACLCSILGERVPKPHETATLKEEHEVLVPLLEDTRKRKDERVKQFSDLKTQIQKVHCEISGSLQPAELPSFKVFDDEKDLSLTKFNELISQLQALQKEKSDRLYRVLEYVNTINELCRVLGCDFLAKITEVHPSLKEGSGAQAKSISNETIEQLARTIESLRREKRERMQQLQDYGASLVELWNLMDTSNEDQQAFQHVTCSIAASEEELTAAGALSMDVLEQAKHEAERLHQLKASKIKEILVKKQIELEEICKKAHTLVDANTKFDMSVSSLESGLVDPAEILTSIEEQIGRAREEAFSRKEIMEKVEKWTAACEEESWLEDYNKDENRYNASKGAHINLKRAERARASIAKIPALVESLMAKIKSWEEERGKPFLYDGVQLLSTLREYTVLRIEKEEGKRRHRDKRRLHEQLVNEQETLFGTKMTPNNRTPCKKVPAMRANGLSPVLRRLSPRRLSPAKSRLQAGITPSRHGIAGSKESRKRPGALTSNQVIFADDNYSPAAIRQPLSPVSSPIVRQNMNSTDSGKKKRYNACGPVKSYPLRSPRSVAPVQRPEVIGEENMTAARPPSDSLLKIVPSSPLARCAPIGEQIPTVHFDHAFGCDSQNHPLHSTLNRQHVVLDEGHTIPCKHEEQPSMTESQKCPKDEDQQQWQEQSMVNRQEHYQQQKQQWSTASQQKQEQQQSNDLLLQQEQKSTPAIFDQQQEQQHQQQLQPIIEYSFEEKRLGFMYHPDTNLCTWTGCA